MDSPEEVLLDEKKIRAMAETLIMREIGSRPIGQRPFFFETIVCDFFTFKNFGIFKSKKTRDLGLDALLKTTLEPFGSLSLGLQIKYKRIASDDVGLFLQALDFAEIRLGVLVCKDSARLDKYTLSSKTRAILFGLGGKAEMQGRIDLKPVFIMKFSDILDLFAAEIRAFVRSVYKE